MSDGATPGIGDVLGDSGALPEIVHNGKTWKIGKPTQRAKDALEELVVADAVAEVTSLKTIIPADSYREMFESLRTAIGAKHYATWSSGWLAAMGSIDGSLLFATSLLRERHPEATVADARALAEDKGEELSLALIRVVPDFLAFLVESLPAPPEKKKLVIESLKEQLLRHMTPTTPTEKS